LTSSQPSGVAVMLIGAASPVATSSSASGGGSAAIGASVGEPSMLASALAEAATPVVGDAAWRSEANEEVEGDGVAHAARARLMTNAVSARAGLNIGPILGRSGRVEPQR
jgi:hypothetical protein